MDYWRVRLRCFDCKDATTETTTTTLCNSNNKNHNNNNNNSNKQTNKQTKSKKVKKDCNQQTSMHCQSIYLPCLNTASSIDLLRLIFIYEVEYNFSVITWIVLFDQASSNNIGNNNLEAISIMWIGLQRAFEMMGNQLHSLVTNHYTTHLMYTKITH